MSRRTRWLPFPGVAVRSRRRPDAPPAMPATQLLAVLDGLPVGVMVRAEDGTLLHRNPGGHRYVDRLGVDVSAIQDSPSSLLDHVEVVDETGQPHDPEALPVVVALRESRSHDSTVGFALPGGGHAWYSIRTIPLRLDDGTTGTVVTLDDVTEAHEARHRLALAERSLRSTFDHAPIGIAVIAPSGRLMQVNAALCELLGRDAADLMANGLGQPDEPDQPDDRQRLLSGWLAGDQGQYQLDHDFQHRSGRVVHTEISVAPVRDDDGTPLHLIAQIVDVTHRHALEQELRTLAVQDSLTGLANRRALADRLVEAQHRRARDGGDIGLLYLDLDDFKQVNDAYGHDVGDRMLVAFAQRLRTATREADTICRIGGDEFVVLCTPVDGAAGLRELVERLGETPPATVRVDDTVISVSETIGAALVAPEDDLDRALRRADTQMYARKRSRQGLQPLA